MIFFGPLRKIICKFISWRLKTQSGARKPKLDHLERQEALTSRQEQELSHLTDKLKIYNKRIDIAKLERS